MFAADDLRRVNAEWEQHQQELFNRDDGPSWWLRKIYRQHEDQAPGPVEPAEPVTDHLEWRRQLDLDHRGLDRGQHQQLGHRGDQLPQQLPSREHVAAARALEHGMGATARAEYAQRQHQAADQIYGFRSR